MRYNQKAVKNAFDKRIWELDFLRGFAILIMLYGHFIYDLAEIANVNVDYEHGFTYYFGRVGAFLFISVSGACCILSRSNFKRGFKLLLIALGLSAVTYFLGQGFFIKFGILHFFAVVMMLYSLIEKVKITIPVWAIVLAGFVSLGIGELFKKLSDPTGILFPLGIISPGFYSADYYPIFPYIGIFLLGIAFGLTFYKDQRKSILNLRYIRDPLSFAGRHSLIIYLLHQPVLVGSILLFQKILS